MSAYLMASFDYNAASTPVSPDVEIEISDLPGFIAAMRAVGLTALIAKWPGGEMVEFKTMTGVLALRPAGGAS